MPSGEEKLGIQFSVQNSPCSIQSSSKDSSGLQVGIGRGRNGLEIHADVAQTREQLL